MTFFIGVDLHKTQFTVHVRTEEKVESLDQIKQYPTTVAGYAEFLSRIETYRATGAAVKIGVESTGNTRFFKNQVEKAGAEVTVINTLKFKVINESAKKTFLLTRCTSRMRLFLRSMIQHAISSLQGICLAPKRIS